MPSIVRIVLSLAVFVASANAASLGKECYSNSDCSDGATCVAGDSVNSVQRCVAGPVCSGSIFGACPGDEVSGQLACIKLNGVNKCVSLDRCDKYLDGQCSASCTVNGKQCNGRGTCMSTTKGTETKPSFACECNSGWNGTLCDNVVDDTCVVDAGQCGDHGTCVKSSCECKNGYTGKQCQIPPHHSSSSGSLDPTTPTKTTTSPVPSPSKTSAPNSEASRANSNNEIVTKKSKGSGPSALVIILAVLVALIVIGAIAFVFIARKRRREQEAADARDFSRADSVTNPEGGRPPTPKQKIVIM